MISKNSIASGTAAPDWKLRLLRRDDSAQCLDAVHHVPGDYPSSKEGDVLTVKFTVMDSPCRGLKGGSAFKHTEVFSISVAADDQAESDRLWKAIVANGGQVSACG